MHVYEIKVRGHCYLSAESTAFPVTCIVAPVVVLVAGFDASQAGSFFLRGVWVFLIGHVVALIYAALLTKIMRCCLRGRIEAERATTATT